MITPLEISVNAANPAMPLPPLVSFLGSPSSLRLVGVPRAVGSWRITAVAVTVTYPDGSIVSRAAVLTGCAWVATLDGCAKPGAVTGGYTITADGIDERGEAVSGYVLGRGDVVVLDRDGTVTVGETTYYLHLLAAKPDSPKRGDVYVDGSGALILFDGTAWVPFAPPVDLTTYATKGELGTHVANTQNPHAVTAAQVGAYTKAEVDTKLAAKADKATTIEGYGITDAAKLTDLEALAAKVDAANAALEEVA